MSLKYSGQWLGDAGARYSGLAPAVVYSELQQLLESGLLAVPCLPAAPRVLLLRAVAVIVRGLRSAATGSAEGGRQAGRQAGNVGVDDEDSQVIPYTLNRKP